MSKYEGYGQPFDQPDPTIGEFRECIDEVSKEISYDGKTVDSHKGIPALVRVRCLNSDDEFTLVGYEVDGLPGCGCPSGITLEIRKD
jgi:hypothetical protein